MNDVVVTSGALGRMVELEWAVGGEALGSVPCDGIICATPSGSTAYNLSNGGPVLMWGIDAMAMTFVAPHSLHARPLVVPARQRTWSSGTARPTCRSPSSSTGTASARSSPAAAVAVRLGAAHTLLATLPDATFVSRYREPSLAYCGV